MNYLEYTIKNVCKMSSFCHLDHSSQDVFLTWGSENVTPVCLSDQGQCDH